MQREIKELVDGRDQLLIRLKKVEEALFWETEKYYHYETIERLRWMVTKGWEEGFSYRQADIAWKDAHKGQIDYSFNNEGYLYDQMMKLKDKTFGKKWNKMIDRRVKEATLLSLRINGLSLNDLPKKKRMYLKDAEIYVQGNEHK